jgi:hypothetical protein
MNADKVGCSLFSFSPRARALVLHLSPLTAPSAPLQAEKRSKMADVGPSGKAATDGFEPNTTLTVRWVFVCARQRPTSTKKRVGGWAILAGHAHAHPRPHAQHNRRRSLSVPWLPNPPWKKRSACAGNARRRRAYR